MQEFPLVIDLQISDKGEDAHFYDTHNDAFVMAIFDGLGGRSAGYSGLKGGKIASQLASKITQNFLKQYKLDSLDNAIKLQKDICRYLKSEADTKITPSKLKGTLANKRLCTTMAIASISTVADQEDYYQVNWGNMGDSRIYFLSPEQGLQQLTQDDIEAQKNALEMIREDPPMSQFLTADIPEHWQINFHTNTFKKGCFLACSDGCFQYLPTPWHFEKLLLETLARSQSKSEWEKLLIKEYENIKQDDTSLILYPIGFTNIKSPDEEEVKNTDKSNQFAYVKEAYQERLEYLKTKFFNSEFRIDEMQNLWEIYRHDYEEKLPKKVIRKPVEKTLKVTEFVSEIGTEKFEEIPPFLKGKEPVVYGKKPERDPVTEETSASKINDEYYSKSEYIPNLIATIKNNYYGGYWQGVIVNYEQVKLVSSISEQILEIVADSLFKLNQLEEALKICWQINNQNNENVFAYYLIGKIKHQLAEINHRKNYEIKRSIPYENGLQEAENYLKSALNLLKNYSKIHTNPKDYLMYSSYDLSRQINYELGIVQRKINNYRRGY